MYTHRLSLTTWEQERKRWYTYRPGGLVRAAAIRGRAFRLYLAAKREGLPARTALARSLMRAAQRRMDSHPSMQVAR